MSRLFSKLIKEFQALNKWGARITALLRSYERMKKKGWLQTTPGEDARTMLLKAEPEGLRLIRRAYPAWQAAQRKAGEVLGEKGLDAIMDIAGKLFRTDQVES
ncbi:hypothetical protein ACFL2Q_10815 [Thermodesulfobacteriota bacterium]